VGLRGRYRMVGTNHLVRCRATMRLLFFEICKESFNVLRLGPIEGRGRMVVGFTTTSAISAYHQ